MRLNIGRASVWGILALGLIAAPGSAANVNVPPKATGKTTPAANTSTVVTTLHQVKTLLDTAIHDYDGHRAKAVGEVHHAIHELSPHHKGNKVAAVAGGAKETTIPGENQAQSDVQLKQALQLLNGLNGQIPTTHPKAVTHLSNAIAELNVALKIK